MSAPPGRSPSRWTLQSEDVEDLTAKLARELGFTHVIHHETSAAQAAAAAPTEEHTMSVSLTGIAGDIKNAIENADQWVKEVTEQHLPSILAMAAKYENSPIVQALEGALLPPEVEAGIAATITALAKQYPAQAAPAAPAEPVPAAQG